MPTYFFLRSLTSPLTGAGNRLASQTIGSATNSAVTTTTAGGTKIQVTATAGGTAIQWFTQPISAAVTISGSSTILLRGSESAATVNAGFSVLVERCDNAGAVLSTIIPDTSVGGELPTITGGVSTTVTPTSTSMSVGERIKITVFVVNVGTMDAGTVTLVTNAQIVTIAPYVLFDEDIVTDEVIEINQYVNAGRYGYN
jgi:hypothetical protein